MGKRRQKDNWGRSRQREVLFWLLFRIDFYALEDLAEQEELFWQSEELEEIPQKAREYISGRFRRLLEVREDIDARLSEKVEGWSLGRIGKAELTALRLAMFEIEYDPDIPRGVAIDEAVELAKRYGQHNWEEEGRSKSGSGVFVNGVLAKFDPR